MNSTLPAKSKSGPLKKFLPLLIWLSMGLISIMAFSVFILQLQANRKLNKELKEQQEELKGAQSASRKLEALEKKTQELKQKENKMKKLVAVGEVQPLGLIKTITGSASKMGLRKISFELKASSALASKDSKTPVPAAPAQGPAPLYFQMKFDSTFIQALKFIKELNEQERIVGVEKIEITRKTDILPYQSVTLDLVTYSYPE
jgi:hypothetical protein